MKDKKAVLGAAIMTLCGVAIILCSNGYAKSIENAKDAKIKELIGDATVTEATGHAQGFAGEITATVKYAENIIVDLEVSHEAETPEIGGAAISTLKAAILDAHTFEGVDVVSGATYTSEGVVNAIKDAMGIEVYIPTDEELFAQAAAELLPGSAPVEGAVLSENVLDVWTDGCKYVMLVQGVGHYPENPFKMAIVLDENGAVENFKVVYSHETDGFGTEVLQEAHWNQYFGATAVTRKSSGEGTKIDTVSGATETSVGLYNCVKAAFAQFAAM